MGLLGVSSYIGLRFQLDRDIAMEFQSDLYRPEKLKMATVRDCAYWDAAIHTSNNKYPKYLGKSRSITTTGK
jgi:hypothetical protein